MNNSKTIFLSLRDAAREFVGLQTNWPVEQPPAAPPSTPVPVNVTDAPDGTCRGQTGFVKSDGSVVLYGEQNDVGPFVDAYIPKKEPPSTLSGSAIAAKHLFSAGQKIVDAAAKGDISILGYKRNGATSDDALEASIEQRAVPTSELTSLLFTEDFGLVPANLRGGSGYDGDPKLVPPSVRKYGWAKPVLEAASFHRWANAQTKKPPTSKDRAAALKRLVQALRENWRPTKEFARECLDYEGFVVSGDQHEAIWTEAWEILGELPPQGRPTRERLAEMRDPKYRWTLLR